MIDKTALFQSVGSPCPYLAGKTWKTHFFVENPFSPALYEGLLSLGFRRSGEMFYRNGCPGCDECKQVRIPAADFCPSRSQKRVWRRNQDIRLELVPAAYRRELFSLYRRYQEYKHSSTELSEEDFRYFYCSSPVDTRISLYLLGDRILGAGWLDFLPRGLSSVYFIFDPDFAHRSLGTYSVLREIALTRDLGLSWYYLGFVVEGSPKMAYKGAFQPQERLEGLDWVGQDRT